MNYTEIIEKLNVLNGWVLISVIVSVAAALLAIACIRAIMGVHKLREDGFHLLRKLRSEITEGHKLREIDIRDLKSRVFKLESLIREKQEEK